MGVTGRTIRMLFNPLATERLRAKEPRQGGINEMLVKPMHRSLLDLLKVGSRRNKPAQAFRLEEEKKGRHEEISQIFFKKTTPVNMTSCPDFKGDWRQHYGVSVSLCPAQQILS